MISRKYTKYDGFSFIVKTPGDSKCRVISTDIVLTHSNDIDYFELFEEFNGALFCSSADPDFESIVSLYNGPVSFECIAVDRDDISHRSLQWLKDELLKELRRRYTTHDVGSDVFYDLIFI